MKTKTDLTSCEECGCFYVIRPPKSNDDLCETCKKLKEPRKFREVSETKPMHPHGNHDITILS